MNSYDKILNIQSKNDSILCIGLDPDLKKFPEGLGRNFRDILTFNKEIINATKDATCAYKLNFAFYEQYGLEGMEILKKTFDIIPNDIFTIADAKRGDIGNTSACYAKSIFDYFGADSVTLHPYMGFDSVEPFLQYKDKMVFLLALTSNKGSEDFQRLFSNSNPIYRHVVEKAVNWAGKEQIGFVVGATHPNELKDLRNVAPNNFFLIPGIGAQGGDIEATLRANSNGPAIINVSRAIIYASSQKDYAAAAYEKAKEFNGLFHSKL